MLAVVLVSIAILALLAASAFDIGWRLIPDSISIALVIIGVGLRLQDGGLMPVVYGLLAAVLVFAVMLGAFAAGIVGGGDVKLAAAATLLVPVHLVPTYLMAVALAGGIVACVYGVLHLLLRNRTPRLRPAVAALPPRSRPLVRRLAAAELRRIRAKSSIPYGLAIAAGALVTMGGLVS